MIRDQVGEPRHEQSQRLKPLRPDSGEELDVSEPAVCVDVPPARPAPTNQEGGS